MDVAIDRIRYALVALYTISMSLIATGIHYLSELVVQDPHGKPVSEHCTSVQLLIGYIGDILSLTPILAFLVMAMLVLNIFQLLIVIFTLCDLVRRTSAASAIFFISGLVLIIGVCLSGVLLTHRSPPAVALYNIVVYAFFDYPKEKCQVPPPTENIKWQIIEFLGMLSAIGLVFSFSSIFSGRFLWLSRQRNARRLALFASYDEPDEFVATMRRRYREGLLRQRAIEENRVENFELVSMEQTPPSYDEIMDADNNGLPPSYESITAQRNRST